MQILSVSVVFAPSWQFGGTPVTAYGCAAAMIRSGIDLLAITTGDETEKNLPVLDAKTYWGGVPVIYCRRSRCIFPFYSPTLKATINSHLALRDVATIRSSWTYVGPTTATACRKQHVPYVAYPEGNFDAWALSQSSLRKHVYWRFWDRMYFENAAAIVALTTSEADSIRQMGLKNRIEVIPNGIDIESYAKPPSRDDLHREYPQICSRPYVLFLGRLHPKKGIEALISAFGQIYQLFPEHILVIAGDGAVEYRNGLQRQIMTIGLSDRILMFGSVAGQTKIALLNHADVFVLPSYSEGLPMAVLEAAACSTPLIISRACNLPEFESANAAIVIEPNAKSISLALKRTLHEPEAAKQMGLRGFTEVCKKFTWDLVAKSTVDLCHDIVG